MFINPRISLNHLTYNLSEKSIFSDLSLTFSNEKYGIVGANGVGKSTLIKLIMSELPITSGSIQIDGEIAYTPQELDYSQFNTVADLLEVSAKLEALQRISKGSIDENDFNQVGDDWLIQERVTQELADFSLAHINLYRTVESLSGGELNRLLLAKSFLSNADFIILDEPTNNLDGVSRQELYKAISQRPGGMLIVSHDRELLNLMDNIIEISSLGVKIYGGNYQEFVEKKQTEQEAAKQALQTAKLIQQKAKEVSQERRERHEQAQAKGRRARKEEIRGTGRLVSRIEFNSAKGRSEKTQRKIILQSDRKLSQVDNVIEGARQKITSHQEITVDLAKTRVPNGKMVLEIKNITFQYQGQQPIIENFSMDIQGPERIALLGANGSGKSTLVKLILGDLKPAKGSILFGVKYINYLDQKFHLIDPELTLLENFLKLNPDTTELDARYILADFLFRNEAALKLAKNLSSGERLRAALACILMSTHPPQLLILDEPTNHLDLYSIASIESALKNYQGSLLVISHDQAFLKNIEINRFIKTPFKDSCL